MQKRAKCTLGGTLGGTSEAGGGMQTQARERAGSRSCARGSYTHLAMEAHQKGKLRTRTHAQKAADTHKEVQATTPSGYHKHTLGDRRYGIMLPWHEPRQSQAVISSSALGKQVAKLAGY
eukprot:6201723-Pleurochrysis_carterae.AAC.1